MKKHMELSRMQMKMVITMSKFPDNLFFLWTPTLASPTMAEVYLVHI